MAIYQGEIGTWIDPITQVGYSGPKRKSTDIPADPRSGLATTLNKNPIIPTPNASQTTPPPQYTLPQSTSSVPVVPPPQTIPTESPITKFNLALLDMLKKAQAGGGNENLYAQQTALQRSAIGRQSAITPEEQRNLSPQQQSAIRTGQVSALEPEIDAVSSKIKAQDSRLQNFESILGTMKEFGQDIAKLTPSEGTVQGYVDMLKQGGSPTAIPEEIRNTVMAKMTAADWSEWSRITNEKTSTTPSSVEEYQYYVAQEKAAGRVPVSYYEFKTKATGGGTDELKTSALDTAKKIKDMFAKDKSVVGFGSYIPDIPGTGRADFAVLFDNLKALLSLDNIKYLKGQGQISDAERKLLADASAILSRSQTAEAFSVAIDNVITALSGKTGSPSSESSVTTNNDPMGIR